MSEIHINALRVLVYTEEGLYGKYIPFKDGLNVVRAKNTKGKSSILHLILYAFGIEELLGGKNASVMKPVLREKLENQGKLIGVIESKVQLEVKNQRGDIITITRWVKSNSRDPRLVTVENGPALTSKERFASEEYYVHLGGAAVKELGFHRFLANFIGWRLPKVPAFDGEDRLLYMQTLFPLFYVEQINGWKNIYAPLKVNYKIRDVAKKAIEFFLDLDVLKNSGEREQLKLEKALLTSTWASLAKEAEQIAINIGGTISELPKSPALLVNIEMFLKDNIGNLSSIEEKIFLLKKDLHDLSGAPRAIRELEEQNEKEVSVLETEVLVKQDLVSSLKREIQLELHNKSIMEANLQKLTVDLTKNQEAHKLYKLGSEFDLSISKHVCPTCGQGVEDVLLPQDINFKPMDLEENIQYIKEQMITLEFGITQANKVMERKHVKLAAMETDLRQKRRQLRLMKTELREDPRVMTQQDVERIVDLKWKIRSYEGASKQFEGIKERITEVQKQWETYQKKLNALSQEYFSDLDKGKLKLLQDTLKSLLDQFNFSSVSIQEVTISEDKYLPTAGGFDISFDSSASDHIRIIWAYLLAVSVVSSVYEGNHPKLIIFDEPGQQQMAIESQTELFTALSSLPLQSIVATSLEPTEIERVTAGLQVNIIDLGDEYIIKPCKE